VGAADAAAATPGIGLGAAADFAVLAATTVTNAGSSVIQGDLGVSPGRVTGGMRTSRVLNGDVHRADAVARGAQRDVAVAFAAVADLGVTGRIRGDLAGRTIPPGVYAGHALTLSGTVTLDAQGDPRAVFVFRSSTTLVAAAGSRITLVNGATSCNVFWLTGTSVDIGAGSVFVGTVLARTSIDLRNEAVVEGRLLARKGAVTLDTNTFTRPDCPDTVADARAGVTAAPTTVATGAVLPTARPAATRGVPDAAVSGGVPSSSFPVHLGRSVVVAFAIAVSVLLVGLGLLALRRRRRFGTGDAAFALRSGHARLPR
jgi:hypothetical protein